MFGPMPPTDAADDSALLRRLTAPGPKRVLALDGGGMRGLITLGFLARIERVLRERFGAPDLRLADYFDLIGGTSTGAIIAAALALGMEVEAVRADYLRLGRRVFGHRHLLTVGAAFDARPLEEELRAVFGERRLDDPGLRTGLCVVAKRADTRSTWPLLNHPGGRYFASNREIPLWAAVRASAAAPGYFTPELVDVGGGETGLFVDGGVSMAKNPALLLFAVATLRGFPFHWPVGEEQLFLLSVGTGTWRDHGVATAIEHYKLWDWAREVPHLLIEDSSLMAQLVLQAMSRSPTPVTIDAEIGDEGDDLWTGTPALGYVRYDVHLDAPSLAALDLGDLVGSVAQLRRLDAADACDALDRVGRAAARAVLSGHFPAAFDPRPAATASA